MRLKQRRKVDLPQPEGPISAVTLLLVHRHVDVLQRVEVAVVEAERFASAFGGERPARCGSEVSGAAWLTI